MAKALLIKRDDVMTFSNVNGNIDTDKMIPIHCDCSGYALATLFRNRPA